MSFDIHLFIHDGSGIELKLDQAIELLKQISSKEDQHMALGQEILDAVTAENTLIDSFIALVQGLVANNTIDQPTADAIKAAISAEAAKVQAAIVANTPVAP